MIAAGTVLGGKYLVERVLGEGGMGVVVAAKHLQLGHTVAIKMMLAEGMRNADTLSRFEREARAAAELSSEHVARVTDVGHFEDGMPYMVMEYLEGEDLASRIQREGPLPIGDLIRMFLQACIGLGDAHERGIVHRDIKPSNLFLAARRGGRVTLKVLDFGIAKANRASTDHQLTRTSALMGAPQYMSPEQLRDTMNVDGRTDMWSLGASMYEALTGAAAFPAQTLAELHVKILTEPPISIFRFRPDAPPELEAVLVRCLAKDPSQRFPTMQALQDALDEVERVAAVPRIAFQSNPSLIETALPKTDPEPSLERAGSPQGASLSPSQPTCSGSSSAGERVPSRAPSPFVPTFAATDTPMSHTMGADVRPSLPQARMRGAVPEVVFLSALGAFALGCASMTGLGEKGDYVFASGDAAARADGGGTQDAGGLDAASVQDATITDGAATDATTPDAGVPDAGSTDATSADAATMDANVSDAELLDAGATDGGTPDAGDPRELTATTAPLLGDGLSNCGLALDDVCARSLLVPSGSFGRQNDVRYPAAVSDFRLDRYEITVGRFRKFVDAWMGGWRPAAGAGKHTYVNGGLGLATVTGGYESGWNASWSSFVGAPSRAAEVPLASGSLTRAAFDSALSCDASVNVWSSAAGASERRPMNCLSWYDVHAFCIWDGGFVPTEAEWEYSAAGGSDQRAYPWGSAAPTDTKASFYLDATRECFGDGVAGCSVNDLVRVGTMVPGAGRWGHLELAGNAFEWVTDGFQSPLPTTCINCVEVRANAFGVVRGGSFRKPASGITTARRDVPYKASRDGDFGGRCARAPGTANAGAVACTPETDSAFCTRMLAVCGPKSAVDNCGNVRSVASCGTCSAGYACSSQNLCNVSPPNATYAGTSASLTGDGLSNCGTGASESCGASLLVTGGSFDRSRDPNLPATVSNFRLDKYEVTVGRFRKFVEAWVSGWRPGSGAGKHAHLNGGSGLANVSVGYEAGWNTSWNTYPGAPSATGSTPSGSSPNTVAGWATNMQCDSGLGTFSASAGLNERMPVNCSTYYDVQAFCIWDGGFLPSEAEWEYAATGGTDYRRFPWGSADPPANASLAIYGCYWNGSGACSGTSSIAPVGSAPAGTGRFGHADLGGNVWEWTADWYEAYATTCTDCARASAGGFNGRTIRGGAFNTSATALASAFRYGMYHTLADRTGSAPIGFRCARSP